MDIIEGHKVGILWACQMGGGCGRWAAGVADGLLLLAVDCIQGRNIWSVAVNYNQTLVVSGCQSNTCRS